jgi:two-component system alkaline phosphatase synthesis response regulator PhoP
MAKKITFCIQLRYKHLVYYKSSYMVKEEEAEVNRILVVEDEAAIAELIQLSLTGAGYACEYALDGRSGADRIEEGDFDLILLDIMLPEFDGFELMEYIAPLHIPVIFVTARDSVQDKVKGLRMGADDYLVKPFEIDELLARVESVLRRYHKGQRILHFGGITIDTEVRSVVRDGQAIDLTPKEFELLLLFVRNPNTVLYREAMFEKIWGEEYSGETRTLDLHIQRLRRKLGWEKQIKTIYKIGYRLMPAEEQT